MTRRCERRQRDGFGRGLRTDGGAPEEETADEDEDADVESGDGHDAERNDQHDGPVADDAAPEEESDEAGTDAEADGAAGAAGVPGLDRSNVEVTEAGAAEPADPKWEKPDPEDIPEFETGAEEPLERPSSAGTGVGATGGKTTENPTEGMPNDARSPGDSRIRREGTEGYVAAVELCARLPEDVRLPEQAADLVPAAVEAELEQDVQAFTAAEFDDHSPTVDVLEFVERDGEIWLRLRLGVPEDGIADLDPGAVRAHALEELEGLL
jgi:hypothetical protein